LVARSKVTLRQLPSGDGGIVALGNQRWKKVTEVVVQDWIEDVVAKGGDSKKLLESAKALLTNCDK